MTPGQLLDRVREYYLERFREAVAAIEVDGDGAIREAALRDENGEVAREGAHALPLRNDVFVVRGDEVVQMYIRDRVSSVTRPVKELKGFERVSLGPGEAKTVTFAVTPEALSFLDAGMRRVVEPGTFDVMVGGSSAKTQSVALEVVGR